MKKISIVISLAGFCLAFLLFPQNVHAAGFVQDSTGVKYQNDDGSFLKDSWVQIGQNIYHVDANGNVQTGWIQIGNLWYLLDANGVCTNPAGTATPPAEAAVPAASAAEPAASTSSDPAANNIFAAAGWLPFSTADANALNNGLAAGLVGFDGTQYWAAPAYVQLISAQASQASAAALAPAATSNSAAGNSDNFNTYNIPEQQQTTASYVLNKNTHKIHQPSCSSVAKIKPSNYGTSNLSVAQLQAQGYTTCGICFK